MSSQTFKILIINPNTTKAMTDGLADLVGRTYAGHHSNSIDFTYFTSDSGVPSINNEEDARVSAEACLPRLRDKLEQHDAVLVCCYSQHPLVPTLRHELNQRGCANTYVTGIFEASVATCLQLLDVDEKFGIVSTGAQWEVILSEAVANLLGSQASGRYVGTETTGFNASELHDAPENEVDQRMKDATKRLLAKDAKAICLGCAGMAGLDEVVRQACIETLGSKEGKRIRIVDGVLAGVAFLQGAFHARF